MFRPRGYPPTTGLLTLAVLLATAISAYSAGTPAGTEINCFATATYTDSQGVYQGQAVSNTVKLTVARKAEVVVTPSSLSLEGGSGRRVVFPAEIRNTGNSPDVFNLTLAGPDGWPATLYLDANGDGIRQSTETAVLNQTPLLHPDSVLKVLLVVDIPVSSAPNASVELTLDAQSTTDPAHAFGLFAVNTVDVKSSIAISTEPVQPVVGEPFTVNVQLNPGKATSLTLRALSPDGVQNDYAVSTNSSGLGQVEVTSEVTGDWTFSAQWPGDEANDASSSTLLVVCKGPSYQVVGLEMVSIPMELSDSTPAGLTSDNADYMFARWLPDQARYALYDASVGLIDDPAMQNLSWGKGYWITAEEPVTLQPQGRLLPQNAPVALDLPAGWSQIGSPFIQPVLWETTRVVYNNKTYTLSEAKAANIMVDYCWTFVKIGESAGYNLVHASMPGTRTSLEPWRGYWVFLHKPARIILQPPTVGGYTTQAIAGSDGGQMDDSESYYEPNSRDRRRRPIRPIWMIELKASGPAGTDVNNFFGVSSDQAAHAVANPPRASQYTDLYFTNLTGAEQTAISGQFATDIRQRVGRLDNWTFEVASSSPDAEITLSWTPLNRLNVSTCILKNLQTGEVVDMRYTNQYTFRMNGTEPARFGIVAGG